MGFGYSLVRCNGPIGEGGVRLRDLEDGGGGLVAGDDVVNNRWHDSPPLVSSFLFSQLVLIFELLERHPFGQLV